MNLDFQAGGSPLAARMNPIIYTAILWGLIVIGILFAIGLLLNKLKEYKETPEWLEKEKIRPTKKKDIDTFARKHLLKENEADFLWKLCRKYKITNILYAVTNLDTIEPFFEQYYLENKDGSAQDINLMFRVKFRLERVFAASVTISSTKALTKETRISEIFPDGSKLPFAIFENAKDYLIIAITKEFYDSETKPQNLEKVAFTFHSETGMRYAFVSRILRYEQKGENYLMFVSHSNDLITKQQRNFKRILTSEKCKIASVSTETNRKNEKYYVPAEKKFDCILTNLSGGGCCISTTLPIKEGQMIYVELSLDLDQVGVFGKIIKTRKSQTQGLFNIHIMFDNISLENQNKILAKVYGYN